MLLALFVCAFVATLFKLCVLAAGTAAVLKVVTGEDSDVFSRTLHSKAGGASHATSKLQGGCVGDNVVLAGKSNSSLERRWRPA